MSLAEFEEIVGDCFARYVSLSKQIGGLVAEQAELVAKAIEEQRRFLQLCSESRKPDDGRLMAVLKPTSDLIAAIQAVREKNRKDKNYEHLCAIAEGIAALGWVTVAPTPAPYIKEMSDASQFYTNKVLVGYKDKDSTHTDWAKTWIEFLASLQKFVRKNHTTGLVWNSQGASIASTAAPAPPPPPPPPAGFFDEPQTEAKSGSDTRAALFASINQGTDITRGLKKVDSTQMTHKNPTLRQSNVVPGSNIVNGSGPKQVKKLPPKKLELEGKKWLVENHDGSNNLTIAETNMSQSINIFNCHNSLLTVKGKVNSITVNQCKKFALVFDTIVSVVEFINCQRVKTQANDYVPTITVDKVDGIEIYLSQESLACEIVSSKSSEVNISVPDSTGEYVEHPLPEQLKSVWNGKAFQTVAIEKN